MKKNRSLGILIGSFTDPEAAQKMLKRERPDFETSEEDYEATVKQVRHDALKKDQKKRGRRRRSKKKREVVKSPPARPQQ